MKETLLKVSEPSNVASSSSDWADGHRPVPAGIFGRLSRSSKIRDEAPRAKLEFLVLKCKWSQKKLLKIRFYF